MLGQLGCVFCDVLYWGDSSSLLDYDGDYYKEIIKAKYNITENEKLLDKITMGRITVN